MIYRIAPYFGGVGDSLQLSTLPEMLTKAGHQVYLLDDPGKKQVNVFRSHQIKQFVWDSNPYVIQDHEECDGEWNCGDTLHRYKNENFNFIKNWEAVHGLTPKNSYPKIYVIPDIDETIQGVIELSSVTLKYNETQVKWLVKCITDQFPGFKFVQLATPNQSNRINVPNVLHVPVTSLFELYDILCSCKCFISLNSGSHSVAAAARVHNPTMIHYCFMPDKDFDSMMSLNRFVYPGIVYIKDSQQLI